MTPRGGPSADMIDSDYHSPSAPRLTPMSARAQVLALPVEDGASDLRDAPWTRLLDHLAAELAREYVRLMEVVAADEAGRDGPPAGS